MSSSPFTDGGTEICNEESFTKVMCILVCLFLNPELISSQQMYKAHIWLLSGKGDLGDLALPFK